MQAVRYTGPNKPFVLETVAKPSPGPNELLIQVDLGGLILGPHQLLMVIDADNHRGGMMHRTVVPITSMSEHKNFLMIRHAQIGAALCHKKL